MEQRRPRGQFDDRQIRLLRSCRRTYLRWCRQWGHRGRCDANSESRDEARFEEAIARLYAEFHLDRPLVEFVDSPLAAEDRIAEAWETGEIDTPLEFPYWESWVSEEIWRSVSGDMEREFSRYAIHSTGNSWTVLDDVHRTAGILPPRPPNWLLDWEATASLGSFTVEEAFWEYEAQFERWRSAWTVGRPLDHEWQTGIHGDRAGILWKVFCLTRVLSDPISSIGRSLLEVARLGLWWVPFTHWVVASRRPIRAEWNEYLELHHDTRSALEYRDGYQVFAWNGHPIPRDLFEKWPTLTMDEVFDEGNYPWSELLLQRLGYSWIVQSERCRSMECVGDSELFSLPVDSPCHLLVHHSYSGTSRLRLVPIRLGTIHAARIWATGDDAPAETGDRWVDIHGRLVQ